MRFQRILRDRKQDAAARPARNGRLQPESERKSDVPACGRRVVVTLAKVLQMGQDVGTRSLPLARMANACPKAGQEEQSSLLQPIPASPRMGLPSLTPSTSVVVLGIGNHGGGRAVIRWLIRHGVRTVVIDDAPADRFRDFVRQLARRHKLDKVEWHFGGCQANVLNRCRLLVVNPAVRPTHPIASEAIGRGIPITTELGLFLTHCPAPVIAITGTNGKTTGAVTTYRMLRRSGKRTWLGGNIGGSLLGHLDRIRPDDRIVLEVSSFQLFWLGCCDRMFQLAAVTSFAPDHLDWHPTLEHYRSCKQAIIHRTAREGFVLLNNDDPELSNWNLPGNILRVGSSPNSQIVVTPDELTGCVGNQRLAVRWPEELQRAPAHVRMNLSIAATLAYLSGATLAGITEALRSFRPVPHRLQIIGSLAGRTFVDDSASTTPHSCAGAIRWAQQHWPGRVWLILGGRPKGQDYSELIPLVQRTCRGVALIGENQAELCQLLTPVCGPTVAPLRDLEEAVAWSFENSEPGDLILLSPAAASTDMYPDYRERGRHFRRIYRRLKEAPEAS